MARKVQRTDWNPLIKNINKLASRNINSNFYLEKGYKTGGFNRAFLSKNYDLFIERVEVKDDRDYNKYLTEKEFKQKYGDDKELLKEYRQQRIDFLEYLGYKTNAVSGTQKEVEMMQQRIDETRELEVGEREVSSKSGGIKHTYGDTKEWTSKEWEMFNDFKKHMTSDEAMELTFGIIDEDEMVINYYEEKGDSTLNTIIRVNRIIYMKTNDVGDVLKI